MPKWSFGWKLSGVTVKLPFLEIAAQVEHDQDPALVLTAANPTQTFFYIVNKHSEKCLDVAEWHNYDGSRVQQWGFTGGDNQLWRLERVESRCYRIISKFSDKCLDVPGGSHDDNIPLQQWSKSSWNKGVNQQWLLTALPDGCYHIQARHSGKSLDVLAASRDDGATITQWPWHGGDNQRWWLKLALD